MVSFGEYDNQTLTWDHYCGGAIISNFGIVTASHCFYGKGEKAFKTHTLIRVGDQNFTDTTDDDLAETYKILTILKHPGYGGSGPKNDLAIVFTDRKIEFNEKVNSVNLPSATNPVIDGNTNQSAKFSGWGWFDGSRVASEALRATNFTIFTRDYCEQQFNHCKVKNHLENTRIMFCAGTDVSYLCIYLTRNDFHFSRFVRPRGQKNYCKYTTLLSTSRTLCLGLALVILDLHWLLKQGH